MQNGGNIVKTIASLELFTTGLVYDEDSVNISFIIVIWTSDLTPIQYFVQYRTQGVNPESFTY